MTEPSAFRKDRHVKYFLRCLKTLLPRQYTSNDSSRMTLGFFTIAAVDLLGILDTNVTRAERQGYVNWIYQCQVPSGGFRGFTGADFGAARRTLDNECWDPANVPATYFALATLLILGDDLSRVGRKECLLWLPKMQREDGSFGEVLGSQGKIEGGSDLRFCCCAAGIRYILRGKDAEYFKDVGDIDVKRLVSYIEACQTYDGGFAEAPFHESHAGLTYCAVGAFSFLEYIPRTNNRTCSLSGPEVAGFQDVVQWLVCRQTTELEEQADEVIDGNGEDTAVAQPIPTPPAASYGSETPSEKLTFAGFNGRLNKIADTCYCFWVSASLAMLDRLPLVNSTACRRFLLEKTQHLIGGFGKGVGEVPDIMHSYLGLANLALLGEPGIASVDPTFCTSKRARQHLESLPWWRGTALPVLKATEEANRYVIVSGR